MSTKISFNKNSIHELNKNLTKVKNIINKRVNKRFLYLSLMWMKEKSIHYLQANFPEKESQSLISEISSAFVLEWNENNARLINNHEKSVYIEFGVGIIGQGTHPKSSDAKIGGGSYQYNLPSVAKTYARDRGYEDSWFYRGLTQGNQAAMYMYNAFMDYYHGEQYKDIYKQAFNDIMKKMSKKE